MRRLGTCYKPLLRCEAVTFPALFPMLLTLMQSHHLVLQMLTEWLNETTSMAQNFDFWGSGFTHWAEIPWRRSAAEFFVVRWLTHLMTLPPATKLEGLRLALIPAMKAYVCRVSCVLTTLPWQRRTPSKRLMSPLRA